MFEPSTQCSPSAKTSFFQIGTVRLSSLMSHSQAAKAARPVRRRDRDDDARFADLEPARAVDDTDVRDLKLGLDTLDQLFHFFESHRFVSFVFEVLGLANLASFFDPL